MHALLLRQFGDPSTLKIEEVPTPVPGPNEALIRIHAASINPSDVKNVQGVMHGTILPRIPGRDFAGTVEKGPPDWLGKEVFGTGGDLGFTHDGSHAEFLLLPTSALTQKPSALSMQDAASAGVTFVTAWSAMVTAAQITSGETALIFGATGGVGSAAVQIAKAKGARVIAVVRNEKDIATAKQNGADETALSGSPDFPKNLQTLIPADADVVFDTTGSLFSQSIESAAANARIPIITAPKDGNATFSLRTVYRHTLTLRGVDTRQLDATACARLLADMLPHFASGKFRPAPAEPMPLSSAPAAYQQAATGKRIVLFNN